jgi:hypothetical protein
MPRNMSGGSGHRSQSNSESSKARNNRTLVDAYLDDVRDGAVLKDVFVGKILKRMGSGRMAVYVNGREQVIPMKGGLRGKGKKSVWVDIDSVVLVAETGLAGLTHEIVGVFSETQVHLYKKLCEDADPKLFIKNSPQTETKDDDLFEQEEEDEVNVDDI